MQQSILAPEPLVQRGAGKGRENRDLYVEQLAPLGELVDLVENFRPVAVEAQYEATVDADSLGLDPFDGYTTAPWRTSAPKTSA